MVNITDEVENVVKESSVNDGIATVFVPGSTAAVTTIEYEPELLNDFPNMLERIAPENITYEHEQMWHDGNGHSHVRASLLGPS
ncbi:MAG: YjbQ family protein, partial [Nitrososphaerales archaeon]